MRYNKNKYRARINKIRVSKQIRENIFTRKQLKTIDKLFDQWVKEPRPVAPLKVSTVWSLDGSSSYGYCLSFLREYSGKSVALGNTGGYLQMPDMNFAISEFIDLIKTKTSDELESFEKENNYAVLEDLNNLEWRISDYNKDIFYDDTFEGSDFTLKKIVSRFNDLLSTVGLLKVPEVEIVR